MKVRFGTIGWVFAAVLLSLSAAVVRGDERSLVQRVDDLQAKVDGYLQEREPQREGRSDEEYAELIERLELGMQALKELGREDALHQLARIADEVRAERRAAREVRRGGEREERGDRGRSEVEVVRERLQVMRLAADAFVAADQHDAADLVERAMHARELALEGRRDEEAARIRESAPDRRKLAELLKRAAHLWAEQGHERKAAALAELAGTFAEQERRAARPDASGPNLDDLKVRLKIVRAALRAHQERQHHDACEILERLLVVGELQAMGASDDSIFAAAKGLEMGTIIELLQHASGAYREWEKAEPAAACAQLAEYYARRERQRERAVQPGPQADRGGEAPEAEHDRRRLEYLEKEEQALREELEGLRPQHSRSSIIQRKLEQLEQRKREVREGGGAPPRDGGVALQRVQRRIEELQEELDQLKRVVRSMQHWSGEE